MESYVKIKLIAIPSELEEDITDHCFSSGSLGVSESLTFSQPDLTYEPDIVHTKKVDLDVFFDEMPAQNFFDGLLEIYPSLKWQSDVEATKDWLEEWKKGFVAFKLVGPYWIVPSWLEAPPEAEKTLQIDPGMAFGTGTHATTQMAAYFVSKICSQYKKDLPSLSLIDVGTGTAVLALLAKMEGTGRVLGIEIDPEARRVAKENIARNKQDIEVSDKTLELIHESFDFVVANIIDGILIQIKNDLLRVLKPGGSIFLTGILTEREDLFFKEFIEKSSLKLIRRIEKDEWVGFWLQDTSLENN